MNEKFSFKVRLYLTGIITIAIWSLLTWNHFHGGVPSHHILARKDLPEISNWWGGLLLPLLTWFLLYRTHQRLATKNDKKSNTSKFPVQIIYSFTLALLYGTLISTLFTLHYTDVLEYVFFGVFLVALFVPIYRAECILGFVIGMTFTFGAILPTGVGSILALVGAVIYLYVRPALLFIATMVFRIVSPNKK